MNKRSLDQFLGLLIEGLVIVAIFASIVYLLCFFITSSPQKQSGVHVVPIDADEDYYDYPESTI